MRDKPGEKTKARIHRLGNRPGCIATSVHVSVKKSSFASPATMQRCAGYNCEPLCPTVHSAFPPHSSSYAGSRRTPNALVYRAVRRRCQAATFPERRSSHVLCSTSGRDDALPLDTGATSGSAAHRRPTGRNLIRQSYTLLCYNLWPMIALYALCDSSIFLLHRFTHRLTNAVAINVIGGVVTPEAIGNLWWLSNNPAIANFQTGYQWLVGVFFLVVFPLNILLRSYAAAAAVLLAVRESGTESAVSSQLLQMPKRQSLAPLARVWSDVRQAIIRVWQVELLVAVRAIPLQAASLLLLPLPWTLPRLLKLQLATPVAVLEGAEGDLALERSARLVEPMMRAMLWPFLGLLVAGRVLSSSKDPLLALIPPRFVKDVPEIPIAASLGMLLLTAVVSRMQDLLPVSAYMSSQATSPS